MPGRASRPSNQKTTTATAEFVLPYDEWFSGTLPEGWTVPRHISLINAELGRIERGEIDRLQINMPPRHGKTESITVRGLLRQIERDTASNYLIVGHTDRFARRLSRKVRTMAMERGLVKPGKTATDEWELYGGGVVMARGIGTAPTGTGFKVIFIDDPIKNREQAESETYRAKVWESYLDDFLTRLEPGGSIVLVMTRWHHDDLGGRVMESDDGWHRLTLPAISDEGESLWPERWPIEKLERLKRALTAQHGEYSWNALYQQEPSAKEGLFFKPDRLKIVDPEDVPELAFVVRAWDIAASEGKGDYTASVKMGATRRKENVEPEFYLLDARRKQLDTAARREWIRETAEEDGPRCRIIGPQDPGAAGKDAAFDFVRSLAGYDVATRLVSGKKELRAGPGSAQVNAGAMYAVRGLWLPPLKEEFRTFPSGVTDDLVDAFSDAFNDLAGQVFQGRDWDDWL